MRMLSTCTCYAYACCAHAVHMLCACHACACLVAVEEDVAILRLEQLEQESAAAAAMRGPALVKGLGLLSHVPAEGRRRRLAWALASTFGRWERGRVREGSGWREVRWRKVAVKRSGWRRLGVGWFC